MGGRSSWSAPVCDAGSREHLAEVKTQQAVFLRREKENTRIPVNRPTSLREERSGGGEKTELRSEEKGPETEENPVESSASSTPSTRAELLLS